MIAPCLSGTREIPAASAGLRSWKTVRALGRKGGGPRFIGAWQCLVEIGEEIVRVFLPDREPLGHRQLSPFRCHVSAPLPDVASGS
jgi:hypothetical protein